MPKATSRRAMRDLRRGAAIRAAARAELDHARRAGAKPHERLARIRAGHHSASARRRISPSASARCLLRTAGGNVLWDCIATLDAATVTAIKGLGGIKAIAISHPHFYTTMVEWARAFDCHIHLNAADKAWIMRPDPAIYLWEGDTLQAVGRRHADPLRRSLRRRHGAALGGRRGGRGVVCAGDILTVATDRKWLSFMRSYPNFIPLSAREVGAYRPGDGAVFVRHALRPLFRPRDRHGRQAVLEKSIARYVAAVEGKRGY